MTLDELITILASCNLDKTVDGFGNPHSHRGNYEDLAFEPMTTTIRAMLEVACLARGACYIGYKGGTYTMHGDSDVYISFEGSCGSPLTKGLLANMVW